MTTIRRRWPVSLPALAAVLLLAAGCEGNPTEPAESEDFLDAVLDLAGTPGEIGEPGTLERSCPISGSVSRTGTFELTEEEDGFRVQKWTGTTRYDACAVANRGRTAPIDGELHRSGEGVLRHLDEADDNGSSTSLYELIQYTSRVAGRLSFETDQAVRPCDSDLIRWFDLSEGEIGLEGVTCAGEVSVVRTWTSETGPVVRIRRSRSGS